MPDHQVFIPATMKDYSPETTRRIVIDPLTRIEGHLRIEAQVTAGIVQDAWSAGTSFRGIEAVMRNRDPRETWLVAQRVCGVCTTVHAIASVRALENALGITIPDNARLIRNILEGAQFIQDHVVHFYHLHALDWVDVVSASQADPAATAALAQSLSTWPGNTAAQFAAVKDRLQAIVASGQLGLFANGYWGHPAYKLTPEANLMCVAHYLEALDWQRDIVKIQAHLGGKNPHPQTYAVGGMAVPVDGSSAAAINPSRIQQMELIAANALDFARRVYLPDLRALAATYPEWFAVGGGVSDLLSVGDFPATTADNPANLWLPRGIVFDRNLDAPPSPVDQARIQEYVSHSWYAYSDGSAARHPYQGETAPSYAGPTPPYTQLDTDGKYSWVKAPRYDGRPMEVGPLARMAVAYAAGHARVRAVTDAELAALGQPRQALFSTLGRTLARGIETLVVAEVLGEWLGQLRANIAAGDLAVHNGTRWNPATWPSQLQGWGFTEAPRGALGHWVSVGSDHKVANYQMVVPTTWNASPRDLAGQRGPYEASLVGTPVADLSRPVEILRTIHSFDPCMACAVHVLDDGGQEAVRVRVVG